MYQRAKRYLFSVSISAFVFYSMPDRPVNLRFFDSKISSMINFSLYTECESMHSRDHVDSEYYNIICGDVECLMWQLRRVCNGRKYDTILFHMYCLICTGCASQNMLRSVWQFLCSAAATSRHQNIWRETYSGQSTMTLGASTICGESQTGCPALQTKNSWRSSRCTPSLK